MENFSQNPFENFLNTILNNIFNSKKDSIIVNELAFEEDSIIKAKDKSNQIFPKILRCLFELREYEIKVLMENVMKFLIDKVYSNILVFGSSGVGKTLAVKSVLDYLLLESQNRDILPIFDYIYLNHRVPKTADSEYSILVHIARFICKNKIPEAGYSIQLLLNKIYEELLNQNIKYIFVFDEIDKSLCRKKHDVLLSLVDLQNKLSEVDSEAKIQIICILNNISSFKYFDKKTKDSFKVKIHFRDYNSEEIKKILKARCEIGLRENAISDYVLEKIAKYVSKEKGSDVRYAIQLLKQSAICAELDKTNRDKIISVKHVDEAKRFINQYLLFETVRNLNDNEKWVLKAIVYTVRKENSLKVKISDVYRNYETLVSLAGNKICRKLSYRSFFDYVKNRLSESGLISVEVVSHGRKGRFTEITLELDLDSVEELNNLLNKELRISHLI